MKRLELLTIAKAAEKARVSERTISSWISEGLLTAIIDGRRKLVRSDHLQQLMRDRYQAPRKQIPRDRRHGDGHA